MASKVFFYKIEKPSKSEVEKAVRTVMREGEWEKYFTKDRIFLKINSMSDQLIPSQNTSPWVVEAVVKEVKEKFPNKEIVMGDAEIATSRQLERAAKLWGFKDIAKKYDVKFVNLSKEEVKKVDIGGIIFHSLEFPKILLDADIMTIPVMKTHCITMMTGALKNQWGCVPRFRHQYHLVADQAIADINRFLNVKFAVVDGTISMEGDAPRTGDPKICNVIFASHDRVAADSAVSYYMGFDPRKIQLILNSEKLGIGTKDFQIVGDNFERNPFKAPHLDRHPVFHWEFKLRKSRIAPLLFKTKLFSVFARLATFYNKNWWYNKTGKKYVEDIIKNTPYGEEFGPLLDKAKEK